MASLYLLESHNGAVYRELRDKYRGVAKVDGRQLAFLPELNSMHENVDRPKVDRLKGIFEIEGCDRANPIHLIPGFVSSDQLATVLAHSGQTLEGLRASHPMHPLSLVLPGAGFICCTRGKSRVKALAELRPSDCWWIIEVFVDLSPAAQNFLSEAFDNAGPYSDGCIYAKICAHRHTIHEKQWWSRLTKSKRAILRRLLNHTVLGPAYAKILLQIPGMQEGFQIGTLPEIFAEKCFENIVRCLMQLFHLWVYIVGSEDGLKYVDTEAVRVLELRCPGISLIDEKHVVGVVQNGKAFHALTDQAEREGLLERARAVCDLIPSISTMQKDFKYVRRITRIVKQLLLGDVPLVGTVEQTAYASFRRRTNDTSNFDPSFQPNYKLLCLHIMQNLTELSGEYPLLEDDEKPQNDLVADSRAWFILAKRADELGFASSAIAHHLSNDPDREEAKRALLNARKPPLYSYESSSFDTLITTIADTFDKAHKIQVNYPEPELTCSQPGEPLNRRCGRQYSSAYYRDRHFLTPKTFECGVQKNTDITSLFVRRSVFLAFWGIHDTEGNQDFDVSTEVEMDLGEHVEDVNMSDLPAFTRRRRTRDGSRQGNGATTRNDQRPAGTARPGQVSKQVKPSTKVNKQVISPAKAGKQSQPGLQPQSQSQPPRLVPANPNTKAMQKAVEIELADTAQSSSALPATDSQVEIKNKSDGELIRRCRRASVTQAIEELKHSTGKELLLYDKNGRSMMPKDLGSEDCVYVGPSDVTHPVTQDDGIE